MLYARRYAPKPDIVAQMQAQTDAEFVHSLRLAVGGGLTRAALVLLGRPGNLCAGRAHAAHQLAVGRSPGDHVTHQHFELPLVLAIDALVGRVRIIDVNLLPPRGSAAEPAQLRRLGAA